jgi:hypothetical protein
MRDAVIGLSALCLSAPLIQRHTVKVLATRAIQDWLAWAMEVLRAFNDWIARTLA